MSKKMFHNNQNKGSILMFFLIFISVTMFLVLNLFSLTIFSFKQSNALTESLSVNYLTRSTVEDGFLRLLRDPLYSGHSYQTDQYSLEVSKSASTDEVILTATGSSSKIKQTYQLRAKKFDYRYQVLSINKI